MTWFYGRPEDSKELVAYLDCLSAYAWKGILNAKHIGGDERVIQYLRRETREVERKIPMSQSGFASPTPIAINETEDSAHLEASFEHRVAMRRDAERKEREKLPFYVLQEPIVGYGGRVWLLVSVERSDDNYSWYELVKDRQLKAAFEACNKACMWGGSDNCVSAGTGCYLRFEFSASRYFLNSTEPTEWVRIKEMLKSLLGEPSKSLPEKQDIPF